MKINLKRRICFFVGAKDKSVIYKRQAFLNDIRILKESGFEVVIATTWREIPWNVDLYFSWWPSKGIFPLIKAKITKKPIVVVAGGSEVVHSYPVKYGFNNSSAIRRKAILNTLTHASKVLSISVSAEKEILSLAPKCNVETVYLSVDTDKYKPIIGETKELWLFTLCTLNKENVSRKKILSIVQAAPFVLQKSPQLKFIIAGRKLDGYKIVESEVRSLSIQDNFLFPGEITDEEKLKYFSKSLIYLQPTVHEGFGVAIAEAMACELPVITSRVAAVPEVIGEVGVYVDSSSPREIAEKILFLLKHSEIREDLGVRGRERVKKNFSYNLRRGRIREIIKELLDYRKRG